MFKTNYYSTWLILLSYKLGGNYSGMLLHGLQECTLWNEFVYFIFILTWSVLSKSHEHQFFHCRFTSGVLLQSAVTFLSDLSTPFDFIPAQAASAVTPEKSLFVQNAGQFIVKWLIKLTEEVPGCWQHGTKDPVFRPARIGHWTFGQRCLHLLWQRACRDSGETKS